MDQQQSPHTITLPLLAEYTSDSQLLTPVLTQSSQPISALLDILMAVFFLATSILASILSLPLWVRPLLAS